MKDRWYWLVNAKKLHWFGEDKLSLCGSWMVMNLREDGFVDHANENECCKACKRMSNKLKATETK